MSNVRMTRSDAEARLEQMLSDYHSTLPFFTYRFTLSRNDPLRDAIESSPELKERLVDSVQEGYLRKFTNTAVEDGASAEHKVSTRELHIPVTALADPEELIFVLGHENAHALNMKGVSYRDQANHDIQAIAHGPQPHDYTARIKSFVERVTEEEAQAHIGGFNATVSALMKRNIDPTPENLYGFNPGRMRDFIETSGEFPNIRYAMKQGLTRDQDTQMLPRTAENIDAMKQYYPEKIPGTFGPNGLLNYYHEAILDGWRMADTAERTILHDAGSATLAEWKRREDEKEKTASEAPMETLESLLARDKSDIKSITLSGRSVPDFDFRKPHEILRDAGQDKTDYRIDFAQFNINPALVDVSRFQPSGIITIQHPGAVEERMPGARTATQPPANGGIQFPDVVVGRDKALWHLDEQEEARAKLTTRSAKTITMTSSPDAMQSKLYMSALDGVQKAALPGVRSVEEKVNVAAFLALQAHKDGLTSIDHVVKGEKGNVFAVQGPDPHARDAPRSNVDIETAKRNPAGNSNMELYASLSQQHQQPVGHTAQPTQMHGMKQ